MKSPRGVRVMVQSDNFEVFKYIRILLKLTGIWPKANATLTYKMTGLVSFLLSAVFNVLGITQIYFDFRGIESVSYPMFLNLSIFSYLPKVLVFFYKRHDFYNILKYLNQPVLQTYDDSLDFYLQGKIGIFTKLQTGFETMACLSIIFVMLMPFYGGDFQKGLPVPFPFDLKSQPVVVYGFLWILQFYIMNLSALNNTSLDILACSFMAVASAQLQILREKLKQIADSPQTVSDICAKYGCTNGILLQLENCIKHHNAIELLVQSIDATFAFVFLIQFAASVCIICITLFTFILVPLASMQFGISFLFFGSVITQLAIYCGFGNEVIVQSEKISFLFFGSVITQLALCCGFGNEVIVQSSRIGDGCYESDWYNCDAAVKKSLFIIMERSKRPYILTAGKFIILSISSFLLVIKSSISYFAVLQTMYDKETVEGT